MPNDETRKGLSRRQMLGSTAVAAGVAGAAGMGAFVPVLTPARAQSANGHSSVAPGELDEYYVCVSGG
jgi:nitrous-oxide reductase